MTPDPTADPFVTEFIRLFRGPLGTAELPPNALAFLARVRAAAMEGAAKICNGGPNSARGETCDSCAVNIRSAAAKLLEESRG